MTQEAVFWQRVGALIGVIIVLGLPFWLEPMGQLPRYVLQPVTGVANMPIGLLFWILMIIWLLAYCGVGWWGWGGAQGPFMTSIFLWFIIFLLGWHDFGFILQGGGH